MGAFIRRWKQGLEILGEGEAKRNPPQAERSEGIWISAEPSLRSSWPCFPACEWRCLPRPAFLFFSYLILVEENSYFSETAS